MENQLIQLYLRVCQTYDPCSVACFQRLTNNSTPAFTDQQLITIFFFFGHDNGLFQKKAMYEFTVNDWQPWFPHLPSYQSFCYRLNLLGQTFQALGGGWLSCVKAEIQPELDRVLDSFPVMLAKHGPADTAKVAREITNKGSCAAKKTHFHGVRRHPIAHRRSGQLPLPDHFWRREASAHDLSSVREQAIHLPTSSLFGDKAYRAPDLAQILKAQETQVLTPHTKPQGGELSQAQKSYNRMVNWLRQPRESCFNWLNEKPKFKMPVKLVRQKVCWCNVGGKLAVAVFSLVFNY